MKTIVLKKPHEHEGVLRAPGDRIQVDATTAQFIASRGIGEIVNSLAPAAPAAPVAEPEPPTPETKRKEK